MKIHSLEVDGFGVWSGLKLPAFDEALTVVYGPNEAGKTTLLEFVRGVLYGFSPARRTYLPPLHGGRPGGMLEISSAQGRFQVGRHDEDPVASPLGQLTITAADGTRHGEHFLKVLLAETDEPIFDNVFAVSLRELQELATLDDTQAADLLYNLSLGLDRVSLSDVIGALKLSREAILATEERPCQAVQLAAERDRLRAEIEQLQEGGRRYGRLAGERTRLEHEIGRLEQDLAQARHHARLLEIVVAVRRAWQRRAEVEGELAVLGPAAGVGAGMLGRWDRLNERLARHNAEAEQIERRQIELRDELAGLSVNEALVSQAARVEGLALQQTWIAGLGEQIAGLRKEINEAEAERTAQLGRFGLDAKARFQVPKRGLAALRAAARDLRSPGKQSTELDERAEASRQAARALGEQLEKTLASQGERELGPAIDRRAADVNLLRRRLQIDQRLDELARHREDLEDESRQLLERQILPPGVVLGLGGVFMCGVVLMTAGMIMPATITGSLGWALAILGAAGAIGAGVMKISLERSNARQLEGCQKQVAMLQLQLKQTKQERDDLDRQIPAGGGPLPVRLEKAELQLAALEELVPLDARRRAAQEDADSLGRRMSTTRNEHAAARRRWREALAGAGLPDNLRPGQLKAWLRAGERLAQTDRRLAQLGEQLRERTTEMEAFAAKVLQVLVDAELETGVEEPLGQLRVLGDALSRERERLQQRRELRRQVRRLRRQQAAHQQAAEGLRRRRRMVLRRAGVRSEQELRQLALQASRVESLRQERETLTREIAAAIGGYCGEDVVAGHLETATAGSLEAQVRDVSERIALVDRQLQEHFERRGQLTEQLKTLAGDRRLPQRQMELSVVEKRLSDVLRRWQVLTAASRALDGVRANYERERQPETLKEASGYLERLTGGRYRRVWTPLGEHALRVDDSQGVWRGVDQLSRGTREQLLLALRLALAAALARRGAVLPMVLDDVLVNFDTHRAEAAARVLRDFAAGGHQLLVFTCHEHILRLFRGLEVPTIELGRLGEQAVQSAPRAEPLARAEPARRRRTRRAAKPEEVPQAPVVRAAPERIAAEVDPPPATEREPEPPALAPPSPEQNVIGLSAEAYADDDGLDDDPWEETADDPEDFSTGSEIEAA